jgi:hypothetical protein
VTTTPDPETPTDPRVQAAVDAVIGEARTGGVVDPDCNHGDGYWVLCVPCTVRITLAAADAAADTVPVDRDLYREVYAVIDPDSGYIGDGHRADLLRRLPDPDADR